MAVAPLFFAGVYSWLRFSRDSQKPGNYPLKQLGVVRAASSIICSRVQKQNSK
jgi:hypothetical protein